MPLPELQKLREKYPEYQDIDDLTLATKISQKYPEYGDLLEKVKQSQVEQPESLGRQIYRETVSPVVSGASTLAFGIPKSVAEKTGTKELIYPEQRTFGGKALRFGSEATGLLGGGALKYGAKLGAKLLPKLAKEGLFRKAGRMGVEGATAGLLQTPEAGEGILRPKERLKQSATWGTLSGSLPFAGKAASKTGEIVTKTGRWVAKNVGGITDATVNTIKKLGAEKVFDPEKAKAEYITQDLAPRIYNKLTSVVKEADNAYRQAMNNAPLGKKINVRPAIEEAGTRLKGLGLITDKGAMTELGNSEIARDSVYGKLLDFYKSADAISGVKGLQGKNLTQSQMIKSAKAANETMVNKDQFLFLRDKLNTLYKGKPSDIDVSKVVNKFYQSGEDAGIKGLQQARQLQKRAFEIEDRVDVNKISRDLIKAKNPNWTKVVEKDYIDLLGEKEAKPILDDLMAHFANIDFELVSETPGAGGGIYPSRSGLLRSGVGKAAKAYYKDIAPKLQNMKKFSGQALKNIKY